MVTMDDMLELLTKGLLYDVDRVGVCVFKLSRWKLNPCTGCDAS